MGSRFGVGEPGVRFRPIWNPSGVQRGFGWAIRGYRCAQPPATVLCPSGAVVRETGSRGRLRRRLDGTRLSWGDVFPVLGRFRFGDWTRGSVSLMPGVSNRHTSPTGHHERNLAPDAPACRHATRLGAPPPFPWMRLVPRPSHPSMRSNRRSPSFAFMRTHRCPSFRFAYPSRTPFDPVTSTPEGCKKVAGG